MSKKKKLPEYRAQYLIDYFTDYAGNNRMFTLCAVTIPCEVSPISVLSNWQDSITITNIGTVGNNSICEIKSKDSNTEKYPAFTKKLKIGISVQCPDDDPNEELGKKIAYGKALKYNDHTLLVTRDGMINTKLVMALLEQEAEYFKKNPESYIAGYKKKMWKYYEDKHINAWNID